MPRPSGACCRLHGESSMMEVFCKRGKRGETYGPQSADPPSSITAVDAVIVLTGFAELMRRATARRAPHSFPVFTSYLSHDRQPSTTKGSGQGCLRIEHGYH